MTDREWLSKAPSESKPRAPEAPRRSLDAQQLVRLQTTAGNQAVQRMLASRPAPKRRLDRLVGFEAEFSVPSLPAPGAQNPLFVNQAKVANHGAPPSAAVEGFLTGGIAYGANPALGNMGPHFQLKADHNALQQLHLAIRTKLGLIGYALPAPGPTMSNLEYVTPAEDELAPNSTTTIRGHLDAIKNHAQNVIATAKTQMQVLGAPAAGAYAGLPEADLQAWLGDDYAQIQGEIAAFKAEVKNSFYLQATVGIIPSALPTLFKSRGSYITAFDVKTAAADCVNGTMKTLLANPQFSQNVWITTLKANHPRDYDALIGVLYLINSYLVGHALNQTNVWDGSSEKNAVPFMSKLDDLGIMMTHAVPPFLQANHPPVPVITVIDNAFANQYATVGYWKRTWTLNDAQPGRDPVVQNPLTFVNDVLTGGQPVTIGSPRSYAAPDPMPAPVLASSGQQTGVQVEYRYISDRPDTNGLAAALMKVVNEVRDLNTQHMDDWSGFNLRYNADQ